MRLNWNEPDGSDEWNGANLTLSEEELFLITDVSILTFIYKTEFFIFLFCLLATVTRE